MKRVLHAPKIAVLYAFFVFLKSTHCTSDLFADLDVTEYCDNQESLCSHIGLEKHAVCQYYGKTGPSCSRYREVVLHKNDAINILAEINKMRSQAAKGLAVGMDQQLLPQAYGMMEVSWSKELASIARVMIKQCLHSHRHVCAATENVTDPILTFMDGSSSNETTHDDVLIKDILAKWGTASHFTTSNQIVEAPDLRGDEEEDIDTDSVSLFYLKMVTGDLTHAGCAAAVYDLPIGENRDQVLSSQIFCYLSHHTKKDMQVYNTTKPIPGTMFTKCGCPPKFRETKDCLCVRAPLSITVRLEPVKNQTEPSKYHAKSTQAYYNNINHYQKYLDEMFSKIKSSSISTGPPSTNSVGKDVRVPLFNEERTSPQWKSPPTYFSDKSQVSIIPIDWTSTSLQKPSILEPKIQKNVRLSPQQILGPVTQNNMWWSKQQVLEPVVQKNEKWTLQLMGTQPTPIPKAGVKTLSNCNTDVNCPPRIVMLPVFSLQNIQKPNSRKLSPRHRRFDNTSLVQSAADDDFNFSEEDEIPQNISKLRSKLLQTVRKMRKNELLDFFSQEQKLRKKDATERNPSNSEPSERNLEPSEHNLEPSEHNLEPSEHNLEPSEHNLEPSEHNLDPSEHNLEPSEHNLEPSEHNLEPSVHNLEPSEHNLEPSEHNLEFIKHILEPNLQTVIPRSPDGRYEQAKKRAMNLLDRMEKKGKTVRLNDREIVQFDTKMRRIYMTMMRTRDQMQF